MGVKTIIVLMMGINVLISLMAIVVVGHLKSFIDPAIDVVIHFSDSKWAS
jgi:hypothetical protein